jgi:hypothetical protein
MKMDIRLVGLMGPIGLTVLPVMGEVRVVRGQLIDRTSADWTVFSDRIEVAEPPGRNLIVCRSFRERDVVTPQGGTGNARLMPAYHHERVYLDAFVLTNYPKSNFFRRWQVIEPSFVALRVDEISIKVSDPTMYPTRRTRTIVQSPGAGTETQVSTLTDKLVTFELYDYGELYVPPARAQTPEEAAAAKAQAAKKGQAAAVATFKFHQDQALAGNAGSQLRLGQLYLEGKGVERDTHQAQVWFEKAAAQGNAEAAAELRRLAQ